MLRIEPAGVADMAGVYRTCLLTAADGDDGSSMYRDPDLVGHRYVGPYIAQASGTQLVVVDEVGSAGYLLSTDDTGAFEAWAEAEWWPALRARYPRLDDGSADAAIIEQFHEPPRSSPALIAEFPAHLHIDLQARARGTGLGRRLIERLLVDLRERKVDGVHLVVGSANANAIGFYRHIGFNEVHRDADDVVMGRRL